MSVGSPLHGYALGRISMDMRIDDYKFTGIAVATHSHSVFEALSAIFACTRAHDLWMCCIVREWCDENTHIHLIAFA